MFDADGAYVTDAQVRNGSPEPRTVRSTRRGSGLVIRAGASACAALPDPIVRRLDEGRRRQRRREWRSFQSFTELAGSTVTVVGLGAIGETIVERLEGFDVETIGVRHTPPKGGPTDEVLGYDGLQEALIRTDVLVLSCPLTGTTEGFIRAAEFEALPSDAIVVNVARGGVVDTEA